jgi:hypothetical protein
LMAIGNSSMRLAEYLLGEKNKNSIQMSAS